MSFTTSEIHNIAIEYSKTKEEIVSDKSAIVSIETSANEKKQQSDRIYTLWNNSNNDIIEPSQSERYWLDGTSYTGISYSSVIDGAQRTAGNVYFPLSWTKMNAKLVASGNGSPQSFNSNNQQTVINKIINDNGLIAMVDLLINGMPSAIVNTTLTVAYTPGSINITVLTPAHAIGQYLYIYGSGNSAFVQITNIVGNVFDIVELIPPEGTIAINGNVVANIPGFSNTNRTNLTSTAYQNILTTLTNNIIPVANLYLTSVNNQLTYLKINKHSSTTTQKTNTQNIINSINTWIALSNSGSGGKFTNSGIISLQDAYNASNSQYATRSGQIAALLGGISQVGDSSYRGNNQFLQRYKVINLLINPANGPLYAYYALLSSRATIQQKITNSIDKLNVISNVFDISSILKINNFDLTCEYPLNFSIGNTINIVADTKPMLTVTITNKVNNIITISSAIDQSYIDNKPVLIKPK